VRESPPSGVGEGLYTDRASKAVRSLITNIGPSRRIKTLSSHRADEPGHRFPRDSNPHRHFFVRHGSRPAIRVGVISRLQCLREQ
jgi:hypothetical protein